jgi:hypothetical protein
MKGVDTTWQSDYACECVKGRIVYESERCFRDSPQLAPENGSSNQSQCLPNGFLEHPFQIITANHSNIFATRGSVCNSPGHSKNPVPDSLSLPRLSPALSLNDRVWYLHLVFRRKPIWLSTSLSTVGAWADKTGRWDPRGVHQVSVLLWEGVLCCN